jgi:hypothetical protein
MIAPRSKSIETMRGRTATTKRGTGWSTAARRGIGEPFKSSNGGPMSWLSRGCADLFAALERPVFLTPLPRHNGTRLSGEARAQRALRFKG